MQHKYTFKPNQFYAGPFHQASYRQRTPSTDYILAYAVRAVPEMTAVSITIAARKRQKYGLECLCDGFD